MKNLLLYLILATKGGETRAKIIKALNEKPMNANQLASKLNLDYKTIQHHLRILLDNNILTVTKKNNYGALYLLSDEMQYNIKLFEEIWNKFGKK